MNLLKPDGKCPGCNSTGPIDPKQPNPLLRWRFTHPTAFRGHCFAIEAASLVVLACIGWIDYYTGYEFGFFIFYFIPVAIASWYCGLRLGIGIAVASAIVWYLSDYFTFHPYSNAFFIYWETFMRLLSFLTTATTLSRVRSMVLNEEKMLGELMEARQELEHLRKSDREESDKVQKMIFGE